jgi:hypothetical protein
MRFGFAQVDRFRFCLLHSAKPPHPIAYRKEMSSQRSCSIFKFCFIVAPLCLLAVCFVGCEEGPTSRGASTQPTLDRDTPDRALNLYWQAIEKGDAASAVDSIELSYSEDADYRELQVNALIADAKFFHVADSHFGEGAAAHVCEACHLPMWLPPRKFGPDDFQTTNYDVNVVFGTVNLEKQDEAPVPAPPMHRGSDGIWRICSLPISRPPLPVMITYRQRDIRLKKDFINAINTGQYSSPDDLIQAIAPGDRQPAPVPAWQPPAVRAIQNPLTAKFDRSTVQGAIGAYYQAFMKADELGITDFFYSDDDSNGKLVDAHAARILSALRLKSSVDHRFQIQNEHENDFILGMGMSVPGDIAWWGSPVKEQGDRAAISFEGNTELPCRKVGNIWKLDITPAKPQTPAELAKILQHDSQILDQITADVLAGKYNEISGVRDALMAAKLSTKPDINSP